MRPSLSLLIASAVALIALGGCGAGESSAPGPAANTYHERIRPILEANCLPCHDHNNIAPIPLTTYDEVRAAAGVVKVATGSKAMPPWSPSDDCRSYEAKRELSADDIAAIAAWVDDGAPEGDIAKAPAPLEPSNSGLDRVDVALTMPVSFTQTLLPDQQRCFVLDWPVDHLTYVTGFGAVPGNAEVVHHIAVFVADAEAAPKILADDEKDPGPGFDCFSGPVGSSFEIAAWVPGEAGRNFPAGVGYEMKPGSKVIFQMHYNTNVSGLPGPDQSTVVFKTDDHVEKKARLVHFKGDTWVDELFIPALSPDTAVQADVGLGLPRPIEIHWVNVHQHYLGKSHHLGIAHAGGERECLVDVPQFDFYWQQAYLLSQPATLNPGDKLDIGCHWDNSPGHQPIVGGQPRVAADVGWGTGSTEEMCIGSVMVTEK